MLKTMIKHFKTIFKHKVIVCRECIKCGQTWRGLMHDNSKFGLTEFVTSAKYFQRNRSPIEAEKDAQDYSLAWQHHKGHNPHHWEYWIDFDSRGQIIANKIPYPYVVEMVCDWIGAGMVYTKGEWKQSDPLDYFNKVRAGRHFHPDTEAIVVKFLECIKDKGLNEFHKMVRCQGKYGYIAVDYKTRYTITFKCRKCESERTLMIPETFTVDQLSTKLAHVAKSHCPVCSEDPCENWLLIGVSKAKSNL